MMAANGTQEGAATSGLPVSTKSLERFTPQGFEEGDEKAPVYLLAPPTHFLRAEIRADLTRLRAQPVTSVEFRRCLRGALSEFLEGEALQRAHCDLDVVEAADVGDEAERTPELVEAIVRVAGLGAAAVAFSEEYAELSAQHNRWWDIYCILAARYALRGWENVNSRDGLPAKFARRNGAVTDGTLAAIPPTHLKAIGARVVSLMHLSADQRKN